MGEDVTPVILTAGASVRMGRVKALCDFDGKTCLELVLDACRGLGTPIVVVGARREEIQAKVDLSRVRLALNEEYEAGQTSSLKVGLAALSPTAEAFLFFPVDYPVVTSADVGEIVAAWRKNKDPQKKIFIPSYSLQRGHPVLCHRDIAAEFQSLTDDAPARTVINVRPLRISYVNFEKPYILMDMDTPEDYTRCLEAVRTRRREEGR